MRIVGWMATALVLMALVTLTWPADSVPIRDQIQRKRITLGQAPRDVRAAIGEPTKVTKIQTDWETTENWVYGEGGQAVAFTFVAGRLARITDGPVPASK